MWEGNLLPFDRFQTEIITIMQRANYLLTDSRQINNYDYVRGQFTTFWQIPDKKNNYNYARGQFTTFWQIPDKKIITIMQITTFWQIPDKKIITIMGNLLPFDRFQTKK